MYKLPELLAPAGSREALEAAIEGGADAVYFGGLGFNARKNAQNFGVEEMRDAIETGNAHAYFEALYPGWELIDASCTQNGVNRGWYISFEMRRKRSGAKQARR